MRKWEAARRTAAIFPVECERESADYVWINRPSIGLRRVAKRSQYECYFDTFEEARAWLLAAAEQSVTSADAALASAQRHLASVRALREPVASDQKANEVTASTGPGASPDSEPRCHECGGLRSRHNSGPWAGTWICGSVVVFPHQESKGGR